MPLTIDDCPMLRKVDPEIRNPVLTGFGKAERQLELTEAHLPELRDGDRLKPFREELARLRDLLARERYQVGFLGPFQCGKSTTMNLVVEPPAGQEPCKSGGTGQPTTSGVAVLRRAPAWRARLHYMSRAQYEARVAELASVCGFAEGLSAEEIRRELPDRLKSPDPAGPSAGGAGTARGATSLQDLTVLRDLIEAGRSQGRLLGAPPGDVSYDRRWNYLNHGDAAHPANLLLDRVELDLADDGVRLPDDVEMIDLPGLGSRGRYDDLVTHAYLPGLHGALLFFDAARLGDRAAVELVAGLKRSFSGSLKGRVWIVLTKCDALTKAHLVGEQGGKSSADGIAELLADTGLAETAVCMIANDWRTLGRPEIETILRRRMESDDAMPPGFRTHPALQPAFEALLEGGGYARVRRLVLEELPRDVAAATVRGVKADLDRLRRRLAAGFKEANRCRTDGLAYDNALECRTALVGLMGELTDLADGPAAGPGEAGEPLGPQFRQAAESLVARLRERFEQLCPAAQLPTLERMFARPDFDLSDQMFGPHSDALDKTLSDTLARDLVRPFFDQVERRLAACPNVPIDGSERGLTAAWEGFAEQDGDPQAAWTPLPRPTFLDADRRVFQAARNGRTFPLGAQGYRAMMDRKAVLVGHQAVHALRHRLSRRLDELDARLKHVLAVRKDRPTTGPAPPEIEAEVIALAD